MNKISLIIRCWLFLYKYERYRILWGIGLVAAGLYAAGAAWLSKEIVNSVLASKPSIISGLPNALFFAAVYGLVTLLHGYMTSYTAVELLTVRDRVASVTDQLVMDKAAASSDITAFEVPASRDEIRLASLGGRSLSPCFSGSVDVLQHLVMIAGLTAILFRYHPLLVAIVFLPSVPLFYTQMKVRAHTFAAMVHKSPEYRQMAYFIELLLGNNSAKEVRVYCSGNFFLNKYRQAADGIFQWARDHRWKATVSAMVWGAVAAAGFGIAYLYIIYLAVAKRITIGDVVMYSGAVFYAGSAIRGLIQTWSSLWTSLLEVGMFFAYLDSPQAAAARPAPGEDPHVNGHAEWVLDHVSFSYPGQSKRVLDNVSLSIEAKAKVAIVGLNGAGKTTLLKLMLRLLDPDEGTIWFRGTDLRQWDVPALRKQFGVVFQDFSRFKLTLYENIAIASNERPSVDQEEAVLKAAKVTGVDEIASAAPRGYDTPLGKEFVDGIELSGGQWQKVALARGMVRNADVVFLDEPSGALDAKAEQAMFEHALAIAQDKTAIIVSHRFSITPMVDRIFVLEHGALIEEGTHNELMELNGKYASMYSTQADMYWPSGA